MKKLLKGMFVIWTVFVWIGGIYPIFANGTLDIPSMKNQQHREQSREEYLKALDEKLLKQKETPIKFNIFSLFRSFSSSNSQYFEIIWGDKKQNFQFYNVVHLFYGNTFTITNDKASEDDINFSVYLLNTDGTRGKKIWWWYNDIKPWTSKTVSFRSNYSETRDFVIIIENDGYFWQNNKKVSWSIRAHTYSG